MTVSDPLRLVWDALDAGGYQPHGTPHDFRAKCPGHNGDNRDSLHVWAGRDRAALWCHAHECRWERILAPIGLTRDDLYTVRLHRRRGFGVKPVRRSDLMGEAQTVANL